jgi:uncharacterized membrane protein YsdA (DUF1294 family)
MFDLGGMMKRVNFFFWGTLFQLVLMLVIVFAVKIHWYWALVLASSIVTFVLYGVDKRRAKRKKWRVPEWYLHILAAVGGFPGAFLARWVFDHKTNVGKHPTFVIVLVASVVVHVVVIVKLFYRT